MNKIKYKYDEAKLENKIEKGCKEKMILYQCNYDNKHHLDINP